MYYVNVFKLEFELDFVLDSAKCKKVFRLFFYLNKIKSHLSSLIIIMLYNIKNIFKVSSNTKVNVVIM